MKKITGIVALCLISFTGFAQSGFGVKGGVNLTNISTNAGSLKGNIDESLNTQTGYVLGVWARLGEKMFLQPEVLVAKKGGSVEVANGGLSELVKVQYTNLDIPILVGIRPTNFLRIMAGPVASVKLSENYKFRDAVANYTTNTNDAFKNSTWGYQAGIGITFGSFDIDLRKEGSLSDINSKKFQDSKFSQKAAGWQLTLGLKII